MIVLLVDDDGLHRNALAELLGARGYAVRACATAAEALAELHRRRPAVLLLDLVMPGMDGEALLARMRDEGIADVPVILTTAMPGDLGGMPLPVRVLRKPFTVEELQEAVAAVVAAVPGDREAGGGG